MKKKLKKPQKKPTGRLDLYEVSGTGTKKIEAAFPDSKEGQENVAHLFVKLAKTNEFIRLAEDYRIERNEEYDLDFTAYIGGEKRYLELAELTPPGIEKGGYQNLSPIVDQNELVGKFMAI